MATPRAIELASWNSVSESTTWETLLLGNGFSTNIWTGFGYGELIATVDFPGPIRDLFTQLNTTDFESVLSRIQSAIPVAEGLGLESVSMRSAYERIQGMLLSAIGMTHVQHGQIDSRVFQAIQSYLCSMKSVFVTNYDLVCYWALMYDHDPKHPNSKDFMWQRDLTFDITDVLSRDDSITLVYYLHGSLFLWRDELSGKEGKKEINSEPANQLLENHDRSSAVRPLFISEGSSESKLMAITKSQYLSFCLKALTEKSGNTVVFGHSLSDYDDHIVQALKTSLNQHSSRVAISIYPHQTAAEIQRTIHHFELKLPKLDLCFFDSTTHPLGQKWYQAAPLNVPHC